MYRLRSRATCLHRGASDESRVRTRNRLLAGRLAVYGVHGALQLPQDPGEVVAGELPQLLGIVRARVGMGESMPNLEDRRPWDSWIRLLKGFPKSVCCLFDLLELPFDGRL